MRATMLKKWDRNDALMALNLEKGETQLQRQQQKNYTLMLKFPDPEINEDIIKGYSTRIESVEFEYPCIPRYCFVKLKEDPETDIEQICREISQISFGIGKINATPKIDESRVYNGETNSPEDIDPYALDITDLTLTINADIFKKHFANAQKIDINYDSHNIRHVYIYFDNVNNAMKAFKDALNLSIESHKLIVKFKRRQENRIPISSEVRISLDSKDDLEIGETTISESCYMIQEEQKFNTNVIDNSDDDVMYVSGEPTCSDTKSNILENAQKLIGKNSKITTSECSSSNIVSTQNKRIKIETDESSKKTELLDYIVKNEPIDDEDYADDYSFNEDEESENDSDLIDNEATTSPFEIVCDSNESTNIVENGNKSTTMNVSSTVTSNTKTTSSPIIIDLEEYRRKELSENDEKKPNITQLITTNNNNLQKTTKRSSFLMSTDNSNTTIKTDPNNPKNNKLPKKICRDELDELFAKMNSEDDDFTF